MNVQALPLALKGSKFTKTPIGTDEYVEEELSKKLTDLKDKIDKIASMPFKMEAFSLLKACLTQCKVVHLMRSLPPDQLKNFLEGYDRALRTGLRS